MQGCWQSCLSLDLLARRLGFSSPSFYHPCTHRAPPPPPPPPPFFPSPWVRSTKLRQRTARETKIGTAPRGGWTCGARDAGANETAGVGDETESRTSPPWVKRLISLITRQICEIQLASPRHRASRQPSPRATPLFAPSGTLTPVSSLLYHLLLLFYQRDGTTNVRASLRTPTQSACYLVLLTVACLLQRNNGSAR